MGNISDAEDTRPHVVYRCYDAAGRLLYIGCTSDLDYRLSLHHPLVTKYTVRIVTQDFPNRLAARAGERSAINVESPLLNKQHNPKRFKGTPRGGFVPVEPIHSLTAELLDMEKPVTREQMLDALTRVADRLGLNDWAVKS